MVNYCLDRLKHDGAALLRPHLGEAQIVRGEELGTATEEHVFFPVSGIVSIVYGAQEEPSACVAMVGHEGIANYHLLFPHSIFPYGAVGHVAGEALAVEVGQMRLMLVASRELRAMFYEFATRLHLQIASTMRASLRDPIEKRLARCLLMHHDRIGGDRINVYHSTIADMLGVRRASVTDAIHRLEGMKAISDSRGCTVIRDRVTLLSVAASSYGVAERLPEGSLFSADMV